MVKSLRAWVASLSLLFGVLLLSGFVRADEPKTLFVCLPTKMSPHELQDKLNGRLKGVEVTVFGRFRDFEQAVQADPPDAVLALDPVIDHFGFVPALEGHTKQSGDETFVLLSPNSGVTLSEAAGMRIAAVDVLGRRGTAKWVGELLQTPVQKKVVRVARAEDLLPLLSMDVTDLVLVSERMSEELKSVSNRSLYSTPVRRVGLARLAGVAGGDVNSVASQIRELDPRFNEILGVSTWR